MFRFTNITVSLVNNVLKTNSKIIIDQKNQRAIVKLPDSLLKYAFYSNDVKQETIAPKSPLGSLFAKDAQKQQQQPPEPEEAPSKENVEQSWRRMKYTLMFFGVSFTLIGVYLIMELGKPRFSDEGEIIRDKYSNMPLLKQYILRTIGELNYYQQLIKEPSREKLLPDIARHPYYSPKYTLVLEFTDVIVHPEYTYQTGWRFKKRPGLDNFLEALNGIYEIVIYTAEQGMTVFPIVEHLDPKNLINYKLVRDATLYIDGKHVKDLDKLNRDLKRTIVVDWDANSTKYHPDNVFAIPRWKGNDDDVTLYHLTSFLLAISHNQIDDIREVVKNYNQYDDPLVAFREKQKQLMELTEQAANALTPATPVKKWTPSFFKRQF